MENDHGAEDPGGMEGQETAGESKIPVEIAALGKTPPPLPPDNSVEGLGRRAAGLGWWSVGLRAYDVGFSGLEPRMLGLRAWDIGVSGLGLRMLGLRA